MVLRAWAKMLRSPTVLQKVTPGKNMAPTSIANLFKESIPLALTRLIEYIAFWATSRAFRKMGVGKWAFYLSTFPHN